MHFEVINRKTDEQTSLSLIDFHSDRCRQMPSRFRRQQAIRPAVLTLLNLCHENVLYILHVRYSTAISSILTISLQIL